MILGIRCRPVSIRRPTSSSSLNEPVVRPAPDRYAGGVKAAFLKAPFQVEFRDVPEPEIRFDEVLLRPKLVGICGNDIQYARGLATDWIRFGHEPTAEVVAVGEGVCDLSAGDLVACQCSSSCGRCAGC